MRGLEALTWRLARPDMAQVLVLFLAAQVVVLTFSWPSAGSLANDSWFALAPSRNAFLALAAAGFGASQLLIRVPGQLDISGVGLEPLAEARYTLLALLVWVPLSAPFEVVSHAASFPATGLLGSLLVTLVTVPAYFGLGLLLRKLTALLRVNWLLPLAVPGVILLLAWFDMQLGNTLFNPWAAALAPSPYPLVAGLGAGLTLWFLLRPGRRPRPDVPAVAGAQP